MNLLTFVVLSLACYRVTRLVIEDTLWEATRMNLHLWLRRRKKLWSDKLLELISCPFCVSVWIAFGMVGVMLVLDYSVTVPVFTALAIAAAATAAWRYIEVDH